jgi:hypothetical protein
MSEYLKRLVTRTRMVQPMQPFVRSTSPVAERDQRIGMTDFEGFELDDPASARSDSEPGFEQGDALQASMPSEITPTSAPNGAVVQRKVASPAASPPTPATQPVRDLNASSARMEDGIRPDEQRPDSIATPSPSDFVPSSGSPMTDEPLPVQQSWAVPESPPLSVENVAADFEGPGSSAGDARVEAPSPSSSEARDGERHLDRGAVHTQPAQRARKVSPPRLEPLARNFAEQIGPLPVGASVPAADADESPHVSIGRINVEVVSPPTAQPSPAAPRPLTAASVSVIGPLSGGVRPNLRLSLRHR